MSSYYTAIIFLSIFSMVIMQICVKNSSTLTRARKRLFRLLFLNTAICAFCEWFGIFLQDTGSATRILHIVVKAIELSVAPSIGFLIAWVVADKKKGPIFIFLAIHAIAECLSGVLGYIYFVDANSHYFHGDFYWIYVAAYLVSIVYCLVIVIANIKKYQYSGIIYFVVVIFILSGIALQMYDSSIKVDYITVALASVMLYVFSMEMLQQNDELTELISRRGYENYISHIEDKSAILFFDVDKFKSINDTYGHQFGDYCLKTIGTTIRKVYSKYGKCFRIGGDEFCVVLNKAIADTESINSTFFQAVGKIREHEQRLPTISIGYVLFDPETDNMQDAIAEADQMMYKYKEAHR